MFTTRSDGEFREDDFRWIAGWGFDFVRLPMCYLLWVEDGDPFKVNEAALARVDRAVDLGRAHGLHVSLNFHRAPGYSVNRERVEPFSLWKDERALEAFCFHWETFARRYRGVPSEALSFDLVNEPPRPSPEGMTRADHERVMRAAVGAIRKVDAERLVILDGLSWGNDPSPELADLGVAQSCRAYLPMGLSHYKASWVGGERWPLPEWPGALQGDEPWDRPKLVAHYDRWAKLARPGAVKLNGVHCGEGGAFNHTPHAVFLRWLRDVLEILTERGIGLALWNFRGPFGVLDSGRADVSYEDWQGHKLDRKLLDLLREF
jgi:endoglucanase